MRDRLLFRLATLGWAALGAGLFEGVLAGRRAPGFGWGLLAGWGAWGLWAAVALVAGLPWLIGSLARPSEVEDHTPGPLSRGLAILTSLVLAALLGGWLAATFGGRVSPGTRPWLTALFGAVSLVLVAALSPAVAQLIARLRPRPLASSKVAVPLALIGGLALALMTTRVDARLGAVPALIAAGSVMLLAGRWPRRTGLGLLFFGLCGLLGGLWPLAHGPSVAARGPAVGGLAMGLAVDALAAASDDDGDGFGDAFGGGDCDDTRADVNPAAREIPGNGRDDNCRGGDTVQKLVRAALPRAKKPISKKPPHIILIVLDAARADRVPSPLTPGLARLAERGTRFTRAFAPSSVTRMSIPALLTGRWISHTRYAENTGEFFLDDHIHTLGEALRDRHYFTAAITPSYPHRQMKGFRRGFRTFRPIPSGEQRKRRGQTAPLVVEHAIGVLESSRLPVFLYLHVIDPHYPYRRTALKPGQPNTQLARYEAELSAVDTDLEPLWAKVKELRKERPVLIAVTADHGEAFGEHGSIHHGFDLYQNVTHVPLILEGPGVPAGQTIDTPVDLLDLGATLAAAGKSRLKHATGHSLWGLIEGQKPDPGASRPLFSEVRVLSASPYAVHASVVEWPLKLAARWDTGEVALFDLEADPQEKKNLAGTHVADLARLQDLLVRWSEAGVGPAGLMLGRKGEAPPPSR